MRRICREKAQRVFGVNIENDGDREFDIKKKFFGYNEIDQKHSTC